MFHDNSLKHILYAEFMSRSQLFHYDNKTSQFYSGQENI